MNLKKYNAFVFDFDGVLANTVEIKTEAFAKLFEEYGPDIQKKVAEHHRNNGGMSREKKIRYYYRAFIKEKADDIVLAALCRRFSSLVVDKVAVSSEIEGAKKFLDFWNGVIPCFIDSATPDYEIIQIVSRRGMKKYFIEVLGSGRTKAENLEYIIKEHGITPKSCLFFGDTVSDYKAAVKCGVNFVGIAPNSNVPLLRYAPSIKWFRNFHEIPLPLEYHDT